MYREETITRDLTITWAFLIFVKVLFGPFTGAIVTGALGFAMVAKTGLRISEDQELIQFAIGMGFLSGAVWYLPP